MVIIIIKNLEDNSSVGDQGHSGRIKYFQCFRQQGKTKRWVPTTQYARSRKAERKEWSALSLGSLSVQFPPAMQNTG